MKSHINRQSELWKYIFSVFPIVDLPFNILMVLLSERWLISLIFCLVFPIIASIILKLSEKKGFQPGYYIIPINGSLFIIFMLLSGPKSPTWLGLINVTVGSSFMFNNPRIGQVASVLMAILSGCLFYFMGAELTYAVMIALINIAFVILFGRAYSYLQLQQSRIEEKTKELEIQNREITDSIQYANRIQKAVLPNDETIQRNIPLYFIYYQPKAIVSGDFYWFHAIDKDNYIYVNADCTGHGVPGAFMTVIASNLLNQTVIDNKIYQPSLILQEVDRLLNMTLKQDSERFHNVQDGMDMTLVKVNKAKKEVVITSAKRPVVYIRNKQFIEIKSNKFSLGGMRTETKVFEEVRIECQQDDMMYLFTDGYHDQFGGPKGKKFSTKKLKEKFMEIHMKGISEQKTMLDAEMRAWKGDLEQIDDICVTGIRF